MRKNTLDTVLRHKVQINYPSYNPPLGVRDELSVPETRIVEFLAEWLMTLLIPAKHLLESRSPHLSSMLIKDHWFGELYLGLKVAASFDRGKSPPKQSMDKSAVSFFLPAPVAFTAGHHLRLTRGPAGNRTTTGRLSASPRTTPCQLSRGDT